MKKRILVVDDEISIRMGIREFAEYQGYDVTGAANGREALELCRQQDFDLIIMDIMMPEQKEKNMTNSRDLKLALMIMW